MSGEGKRRRGRSELGKTLNQDAGLILVQRKGDLVGRASDCGLALEMSQGALAPGLPFRESHTARPWSHPSLPGSVTGWQLSGKTCCTLDAGVDLEGAIAGGCQLSVLLETCFFFLF